MVEEQRNGDSAICPYCKYDHGDMWENRDEESHMTCDGCGKKFNWRRRVTVEYITSCNCKDNNEEHDFEIEDRLIKTKDEEEFRINQCNKCTQYEVEYKNKVNHERQRS